MLTFSRQATGTPLEYLHLPRIYYLSTHTRPYTLYRLRRNMYSLTV